MHFVAAGREPEVVVRHLVGFVLALATLVSPLRVMAQTTGEAGTDERPRLAFLLIPKHLQERLPEHRDAAADSESKFSLEYQKPKSPEEEGMELRVRRARIGLGVSGGVCFAGASMGLAALFGFLSVCIISDPLESCRGPSWVVPVGATGAVLGAGGLAGIIASGVLLARRKQELRELQQAHYGRSRLVQWDVARSRLVF
jgi:hypothetical protein